jgi:iron complex outermembrane receptor protein
MRILLKMEDRGGFAARFTLLLGVALSLALLLGASAASADQHDGDATELTGAEEDQDTADADADGDASDETAEETPDEEKTEEEQAQERVEDEQVLSEQEAIEEPTRKTPGAETIIVTSQKREADVQTVPISVTALTESFIEDSGMTQFDQIELYAPNVKIDTAESSRNTTIRIRGIGSVGFNAGIDPAVGIFVDGVYLSRPGQSVGDIFDVQRIEVLRGPQGTLFGKNTAAGAISLVTNDPVFQYDARFESSFGNKDLKRFQGWVNVPIIDDRVATRLAAFRTTRDGLDRNVAQGTKTNDQDKWGLRSKTLFDLTPLVDSWADNFDFLVGGDYSKEDAECCTADIITYGGFDTLAGQIAEGVGDAFGVEIDPIETKGGFPELAAQSNMRLLDKNTFDREVNFDAPLKNEITNYGVFFDGNLEVGEYAIKSLTAYRVFESDNKFDGDFQYYDGVTSKTDADLKQVSSELRLVSPASDVFDFVAGVYFHYQNQRTKNTLDIEDGMVEFLGEQTSGGLINPIPFGSTSLNRNRHKTYSAAAYGQANYHITDAISLTGGLRVTWERKTRDGYYVATVIENPLDPDAPLENSVFGTDQFLNQSREATDVSGTLIARWFPIEDLMLYTSYARGFKSGGFNQDRVPPPLKSEFDDETSNNFEVGFKSTWFDRLITLNSTFFYTIYDDFQAFSFDGTSFAVNNAGQLDSYGVEADAMLFPPWIPGLMLQTAFGYNNAEYDKFKKAACTDAQRVGVDPGCVDQVQDLSGRRLNNAPKYSVSSFAQYELPLPFFDLQTFVRGEYSYTSKYNMEQDLDKRLWQDEYHLVNLRAGLRAEDRLWELTFWVENLTKEDYNVVGFDIPLLSGLGGINGSPRFYGLTVRLQLEPLLARL